MTTFFTMVELTFIQSLQTNQASLPKFYSTSTRKLALNKNHTHLNATKDDR